MTKRPSLLLIIAYLAWLAAWFWVLSFGFSSSYFDYHLGTRIPVLILALFAIAVSPISCYWTISRAIWGTLGFGKAVILNLAMSAAPLGLFWGVVAMWMALARATGRLAFEADEAMGHGIVLMFCVAVFLASSFAVPLILGGVTLWEQWKLGRR